MDTGMILVEIGKFAAIVGLAIWLVKEIGVFMIRRNQ